MNSLTDTIYNPPYSHIYVEREALSYPVAQSLIPALAKRGSRIIEISHYMDLFGRTHQSFPAQKSAPSLIHPSTLSLYLIRYRPACP